MIEAGKQFTLILQSNSRLKSDTPKKTATSRRCSDLLSEWPSIVKHCDRADQPVIRCHFISVTGVAQCEGAAARPRICFRAVRHGGRPLVCSGNRRQACPLMDSHLCRNKQTGTCVSKEVRGGDLEEEIYVVPALHQTLL